MPPTNAANPVVDALIAQIQNTDDVLNGCAAYVSGVPKLISDAVAAATAGGAGAEDLAPFTDLAATLKAKGDAVLAAIAANTPSPAPTPAQMAKAKGR